MASGLTATLESGVRAALSAFEAQLDKNVSRETVLSGQAGKPYKAAYVGSLEARAMARKVHLAVRGRSLNATDS